MPITYDDIIIGVLITRSLIGINIDQKKTISDHIFDRTIKLKEPLFIDPEANVDHLLKLFCKGQIHLAVVVKNSKDLVEQAEKVITMIYTK